MNEDRIAKSKSIFASACSFVLACDQMKSSIRSSPAPGAAVLPLLVLEVFSIELMLKCFLMHDGNHVPEIHNIAELFEQLSSNRKRQIIKRWQEGPQRQLNPVAKQLGFPEDLPNALVRCANAFEKLRYIYEFPAGTDFYLGALPRLLQELMAETHPDWISWIEES